MQRLFHGRSFPASSVFFVALLLQTNGVFSAESTGQAPSRPWVVYLLPHSHVDIGYTHVQAEVEQKQMQNIDAALELCRKTADYPAEARLRFDTPGARIIALPSPMRPS
jgi:hypothetical protein